MLRIVKSAVDQLWSRDLFHADALFIQTLDSTRWSTEWLKSSVLLIKEVTSSRRSTYEHSWDRRGSQRTDSSTFAPWQPIRRPRSEKSPYLLVTNFQIELS